MDNIFEDIIDKFCKYQNQSDIKIQDSYLLSNIESSVINNIFSTIIQTNYSDQRYNNHEINQDELNSLFDNFENNFIYNKFDNFENMYYILI